MMLGLISSTEYQLDFEDDYTFLLMKFSVNLIRYARKPPTYQEKILQRNVPMYGKWFKNGVHLEQTAGRIRALWAAG